MLSIRSLTSLAVIFAVGFCCACRSTNNEDANATPTPNDEKIVVINANASGLVRRVLVDVNATVTQGSELVEITLPSELPPQAVPTEDPRTHARAAAQTAQQEVATAQTEVERAAIEVQRIEPLVTSGVAPQPQLDAARAQSQQAQDRLQQARTRAQTAQNNLTVQESLGAATASTPMPVERVVQVRSSIAGIVRAINVQVGQHILTGQPIATIAGSEP